MELLTLKKLKSHRGEDAVQVKSEMTGLQGEMLALQGEMLALQKALDLSMAIVVAHEMAHLILRRELHDANAHTPNLDIANNRCVNDFLRSADIDECGFLVEYVLFGFNFDIEKAQELIEVSGVLSDNIRSLRRTMMAEEDIALPTIAKSVWAGIADPSRFHNKKAEKRNSGARPRFRKPAYR